MKMIRYHMWYYGLWVIIIYIRISPPRGRARHETHANQQSMDSSAYASFGDAFSSVSLEEQRIYLESLVAGINEHVGLEGKLGGSRKIEIRLQVCPFETASDGESNAMYDVVTKEKNALLLVFSSDRIVRNDNMLTKILAACHENNTHIITAIRPLEYLRNLIIGFGGKGSLPTSWFSDEMMPTTTLPDSSSSPGMYSRSHIVIYILMFMKQIIKMGLFYIVYFFFKSSSPSRYHTTFKLTLPHPPSL